MNNSVDVGAYSAIAMAFTPSFNTTLSDIDVAVWLTYGTDSVILSLDLDNSGVPGGVIESWTLTSLPGFDYCCTAESVTPTSSILLNAGQQYWIVVSPGGSDTYAGWTTVNTDGLLAEQQTLNGSWIPGTSSLSAFEVDGTAPEPSGTFLVAVGLALVAGLGRVSKRLEQAPHRALFTR